MTFHAMKFVDKYAGWILCTLLSFIDFFIKPFKNNEGTAGLNSTKNILVMKFWGMGSIILSTPLLQALRGRFPGAKIHFLTLSRNRDIVKMFEPVDGVITLDIDHGPNGFLLSFIRIVRAMRKLKIDILFDLEFFTRFSAIVTYLSGARERIGFKAWEVWRGRLHTIGVPFNRYWHVTRNFYNLGKAAGIPEVKSMELLKPELSTDEKSGTGALMEKYGLVPGKYACLNPNAGEIAMTRRWPKNNFAKLAASILQKSPGIKIVFIGNPKEKQYVQSIISRIDAAGVISTAGELNLEQLIIILKNSKLLVSNDSGPLHLAVALGVPTISFFGPETPVLYGHSSEKNISFFKNLDCSPCINVHEDKTFRCDKKLPSCLEEITVEEVLEKVRLFL